MAELNTPKLGTDKKTAPISYIIQENGSYLIGELFNSTYYIECLKMAEAMLPLHKINIQALEIKKFGRLSSSAEEKTKKLEDVSRWAKKMKDDNYHSINTNAFIGMWAANEASIENILSTIIFHHRSHAEKALDNIKNIKINIDNWPWDMDICLEISQKLERVAIQKNGNSFNISNRISDMFKLIDIDIKIENDIKIQSYNEASLIRNTILHRYGKISAKDIKNCPSLQPWEGKVFLMTNEKLSEYYQSIIYIHLKIATSIWATDNLR